MRTVIFALFLVAVGFEVQSQPRDSLLADSLLRVSKQLHSDGHYQAAFEPAQRAFELFSATPGQWPYPTARARQYLARAFQYNGQEEKAIDLFRESLRYFESVRDTIQKAITLYHISLCLKPLRSYPQARAHLEQAIKLLMPDSARHAGALTDFKVGMADLYNAEKNHLAAIPLLEDAKNWYSEKKSPSRLGLVNYHLAGAFFGIHDYERAREYYLEALENLTGQLPTDHTYFPDLHVKLGFCLQKTGDPVAALTHFQIADPLYRNRGTDNAVWFGFLDDLGKFYLEEKQYAVAIASIQQGLTEKEKRYGNENPKLLLNLYNLGQAHLAAEQYAASETCFRRMLTIIDRLLGGQYPHTAGVYAQLAAIFFKKGDLDHCLMLCDSAAALAGFDPEHAELSLPRDRFRNLCQLYGQVWEVKAEQTGATVDYLKAELYFETAARILMLEMGEMTVNSSRELVFETDARVLRQWLDVVMTLYQTTGESHWAEKAFGISGRTKAFLLVEAVRQSGTFHFAGLPDSVVQQEFALRQQILAAEKACETWYLNGEPMHADFLALNRQLAALREQHQRVLDAMPHHTNRFSTVLDGAAAQSQTAIRQALPHNQGILMLGLTEKKLYRFVLTRDTFLVQSTALPADVLPEVAQLHYGITGYYTMAAPVGDDYATTINALSTTGQSLFQTLVAPAMRFLPERVVIVPEGDLCKVSFEALLTGEPRQPGNWSTWPFLGKIKAISYCFSMDMWQEMQRPRSREGRGKWLGVAPFDGASRVGARSVEIGEQRLPELPFSGVELDAVSAITGGDRWKGDEAGVDRFKREVAAYAVVHLATHSLADRRQGDYSYIALGRHEKPMPAKDLYALRIPADMVVLSSCEAASGQLNRGEGIIGMVRAFAWAGAGSIVASDWVADDRVTAQLMPGFYRQLADNMPKDRALQLAKLALVEHMPMAAHPFFWAGFRVFGSF